MNKHNLKSGLLFAASTAFAVAFIVIFFGLTITPANAATGDPGAGGPGGGSLNHPPTLSFPATGPYAGDGIDPNSGNTSTLFKFRVVYTDADDDTPAYVRLCIEGPTNLLPPCFPSVSAPDFIDYTKGWSGALEGMSMGFPKSGIYLYHFEASDGKTTVRLPVTGGFPLPVGSPAQIAVAPAIDQTFIKKWAVETSLDMNAPITKGVNSTLTGLSIASSCLFPELVVSKVACVGSFLVYGAKLGLWYVVDLLAADPPREDFDVKEIIKPAKPIKPLYNSAYASAAARYTTSLLRQAQLYDAIRITYERLQGAIIADKGEFMLLQSETLKDFLSRLAESTEHHREVIKQLASQLNASWSDETNQRLIRWAEEGLSGEERQALLTAGVSETDIAKLEEILRSMPNEQDNLSFLNAALTDEANLMEQIAPQIQNSLDIINGVIAELEILICGQNDSGIESCLEN